jgi:hypothetical protein
VALSAAAAFAVPAQASLSAVGPPNAGSGHPLWYQDSTGLQLGICLDDPLCPTSGRAADMVAPDGEAFYQVASAEVTAPGKSIVGDFNVEAAFLDADPQAFGRIQFTATGLTPGATYTVEHPYGTSHFTAGANGSVGGNARSAQREETDGTFADTLNSPIGPFLRSTTPPPGHIGNGSPTTVTGGRFRNSMTVTGPGLPEAVTDATGLIIKPAGLTTNEFALEGRSFDPNAPIPPAPAPVVPDADGDGVPDSVDLCVNQVGPASSNGCPLPVVVQGPAPPATVVERTVVQAIPGAGAAAAAAGATGAAAKPGATGAAGQAVLGSKARPLAVSNLTLAQRISISRLRSQGLRLSMRVPSGAKVVRIAVYRARNGRKTGPALFVGYRTVSRAGQLRTTIRNRRMLRQIKAGQYVVEVRPGASRSALGATTVRSFRVNR